MCRTASLRDFDECALNEHDARYGICNANGDVIIMNQPVFISEGKRSGTSACDAFPFRDTGHTASACGDITAQQGETDVETDTLETTVICISPGLNDTWDISEKGGEQPIASFDEKEDAYAYASYLKTIQPGVTVLVEDDEGFSPLPTENERRYRRNGTGSPGRGIN